MGTKEVCQRIIGTRFLISSNLNTWNDIGVNLSDSQIDGSQPITVEVEPDFSIKFIKLVGKSGQPLHLRQVTIEG